MAYLRDLPLSQYNKKQVVKELVSATPPPALQSKTRLGQTPLYLAAYWVSPQGGAAVTLVGVGTSLWVSVCDPFGVASCGCVVVVDIVSGCLRVRIACSQALS